MRTTDTTATGAGPGPISPLGHVSNISSFSNISAQVRVPGAEQLRGEKPARGGERLQAVQPGAQQTEPLQQARDISML